MSSSDIVDNDEEMVEELPPVSDTARFGASIGITVIRGNRTGWPKFNVDDQLLPGESVGEFINRINDLALEGAFRTAENTVMLLEADIESTRKETGR